MFINPFLNSGGLTVLNGQGNPQSSVPLPPRAQDMVAKPQTRQALQTLSDTSKLPPAFQHRGQLVDIYL